MLSSIGLGVIVVKTFQCYVATKMGYNIYKLTKESLLRKKISSQKNKEEVIR